MFCLPIQRRFGFTLLEMLLAVGISMLIAAAAVPAMRSGWGQYRTNGPFAVLDEMAREARNRALEEGRAYVIAWDDDGVARLRPEFPLNPTEEGGLRRWKPEGGVGVKFPAALDAADGARVWTFWPDGACEAAEMRYRAGRETWVVYYHPITCRGEVRHD